MRAGARTELRQSATEWAWVGVGDFFVVAITAVEQGQVEFVVEQLIHGMLELPGSNCCSRSTARNLGLLSIAS